MTRLLAALTLTLALLGGTVSAYASDMTADDGGAAMPTGSVLDWSGPGDRFGDSNSRMWVTGVAISDYPGNMIDGTPSYVGAAACPQNIPLGMEFEIEGFGKIACHDRYAKGLTDRFDVYVPTRAEAFKLTGCYRWRVLVIITVPSEAWYAARPSIKGHECD